MERQRDLLYRCCAFCRVEKIVRDQTGRRASRVCMVVGYLDIVRW
jgi:hypothetical protein